MNEVYETEAFAKSYAAAEPAEQRWIDGIKSQLHENLRIGKPLRFDWFREKKLGNKRVFFVINIVSQKAAFVALCTKKQQQAIIDLVLRNKERYLALVK